MNPSGGNFWISYSDLATGLMMVFILVTCMLALQQVRELNATQEQVRLLVEDVTQLAKLRLELAQVLEEQIGGLDGVSVDAVTARVTVQHDALGFGSQQTQLSPAGQDFLDEFIPSYACALASFESDTCSSDSPDCRQRLDPRRRRAVRRVLVTGHADLEGTTIVNHAYAVQRARNVVAAGLSSESECPELSALDLQAYLEARLQPASAGEIEHCLDRTRGNSGVKCSSLPDESDPGHRTVTFEVELVGEDVSGIAINLVALDAVVSQGEVTSDLIATLRPRIKRCAALSQSAEECSGLELDSPAMKQSASLLSELEQACSDLGSTGHYCKAAP